MRTLLRTSTLGTFDNRKTIVIVLLLATLLAPAVTSEAHGTSYFALSVSPHAATTSPSSQLTAQVAVSVTLGPTALVQLTTNSVPSCMTTSLTPSSGVAPFLSVLTVIVGPQCLGGFSLWVYGSSSSSPLQPNDSFSITVQGSSPPPSPPKVSLGPLLLTPGPSSTTMSLNGAAIPQPPGTSTAIVRITMDPGQTGAGPQQGWFPFVWNYPNAQTTTYTVDLVATDSNGLQGSASTTVSIVAQTIPLSITTTSLPNAELHASYSEQLLAQGGVTPYSWAPASSFDQNQLASAGLSLSTTGLLNGAATNIGPIQFTVAVQDSAGSRASQALTLTITNGPQTACPNAGFAIYGYCSLPNASPSIPYSFTLQGTSGLAPYTFSLASQCCQPPPGITMAANGVVAGTAHTSGVYTFDIRVTDSSGGSSTLWFSLTVPPAITCVTTNPVPVSSCVANGSALYPAFAPTSGGTTVYITGVGLAGTTSVSFGSAVANCPASCPYISDSQLDILTPATSQSGAVNVVASVSNGAEQSGGYCFYGNIPGSPSCAQLVYLPSTLPQTCISQSLGLTASLSATFSSGASKLVTSGSAGVTGTTTICIAAANFQLQSFSYTNTIATSVILSATASSDFSFDNTNKPYPLADTTTLGTIDAGPIVIVVTARPYAIIQANIGGQESVGLSQAGQMGYGLTYTPAGGWTGTVMPYKCTNSATSATLCFQNNGPSLTINGSLKVTVEVAINLLFWDIAGPTIAPYGFLRVDAGYSSTANAGVACGDFTEGTVPGQTYFGLCGGWGLALWGDLSPIGFTIAKTSPYQLDLGSSLLAGSVSITPAAVTLGPGQSQTFTSVVAGSPGVASWSADCGSLTQSSPSQVTYTSPSSGGPCTLQAATNLAYQTTATAHINIAGATLPTVVISTATTLTADLHCASLQILPGTVLNTAGHGIYCTGTVLNQGIITTGFASRQNYPSLGGAGGGAQSSACQAGAPGLAGFSTLASGGAGSNGPGNGSGGNTPTQPTSVTASLVQNWYQNGITNSLAGAAGQTACPGNDKTLGGRGANGIIIEATTIDNSGGVINAQGQNGLGHCSGAGLGAGGGGGAVVLLTTGGAVYIGTVNVFGGAGAVACYSSVHAGNGGAGMVLAATFGQPPITP